MEIQTISDDEQFQYWLFYMYDVLDPFVNSLKKDGLLLDYSLNSLLTIESWILNNFKSIDDIFMHEYRNILDACTRYVGETIRKLLNVKWAISLDDPEDVFYNLPILTTCPHICPRALVTACTNRRKGDFLYKIAQNAVNI